MPKYVDRDEALRNIPLQSENKGTKFDSRRMDYPATQPRVFL